MNETQFVKVMDEKGKEQQAEVLFTYEANGDQYVFYAIEDEVFAARVSNPLEENNWELTPVEEDEWKLLERVYKEWEKETPVEEENDN